MNALFFAVCICIHFILYFVAITNWFLRAYACLSGKIANLMLLLQFTVTITAAANFTLNFGLLI